MDIKVPFLGEGATSGTVVHVAVNEGDQIEKDQTIVELENEKAVAPIPATAAGKVTKIHVKEGDQLSVGDLILSLEAGEEEKAGEPKQGREGEREEKAEREGEERHEAKGEEGAGKKREGQPPEEVRKAAREATPGVPPPASPTIRKLARDLGIDLARIRGSEPGGRIVMADLRDYIRRLQEAAVRKEAPKPAPEERVDFSKWGPVSTRPMTSLRKAISRRLAASWAAIPHVTQFDEADIGALMALKKRYDAEFQQRGARLTLTAFVLKALVPVLKKHPIFNSSLDEETGEIVFKEYFHAGVAVDTEHGLLVPVLRDVDRKPMLQLSKELEELAGKARARQLSAEEMRGGSFTLSNQGGIGGAHFTPIINHPEVAILGLGRAVLKPRAIADKIEPRLMLPLCLSYDHRAIDGAQAARFISDLVEVLENFREEEVRG